MYCSAATHSENQTAKISTSGIAMAAWSHDHGYSKRSIFDSSVLQLCHTAPLTLWPNGAIQIYYYYFFKYPRVKINYYYYYLLLLLLLLFLFSPLQLLLYWPS